MHELMVRGPLAEVPHLSCGVGGCWWERMEGSKRWDQNEVGHAVGGGVGIISHVKGLIFNKIKDLILNNGMALRGLKYFLGN